MAEIVNSLFGLPSQDVRQQMMQRQQNFVNDYANTYSNEWDRRDALLGGTIGNALVNVGAGIFGVQDPALKRATDLERILGETQQEVGDDPAKLYPALQQKLANAGYSREALQVAQVGQKAIQEAQLNKARILTEEGQLARAQQEKLPEIVRLSNMKKLALQQGDTELASNIQAQIDKNTIIPERIVSPENQAEKVKLTQFTKDFGEVEGANRFLAWKNEEEQKKSAVQGTGVVLDVNNKPVGAYDDKGTFTTTKGEVIPKEQMIDFRTSQDAASSLLGIMTNITNTDIDNAFGKPNVTGGGVASALTRFAANPEITSAQTKINALGVKEVLTNLKDLKGASSDKEMARVASTFPGFEAPPQVMKEWLARAVLTTTKFLNKNKDKYGFDAPSVSLAEIANIPVVKFIPATERARFIEDLAKYDKEFQSLPESEQIKVLNSIVSGGRLDKPAKTTSKTTKSGVKYTVVEE